MNEPATLPEMVEVCRSRYPDVRAVFAPHTKPIIEMTYQEVSEEVALLGAGLLHCGVAAGEHVALFTDNRPRWLFSDLAITSIGAVDVPRGSDTATSEFEFILEHSGCVGAIIQDRRLYDRISSSETFQKLRFIVLLDDSDKKGSEDGATVYKYQDLIELGRQNRDSFAEAEKAVTPDTLATIVYTSGTTGSPKGVMLSHSNLMTQPLGIEIGAKINPGEILLSILPAWHAYERAVEYFGLYCGVTIVYSDKKYIKDDLLKLCPHMLPCVPRIWESVYQGIQKKVSTGNDKKKKLFALFMDIGSRYIRARRIANGLSLSRKPVSVAAKIVARGQMAALYPMFKLGDSLVYSKMRMVTGGRLRAAVSGGGSLAAYLDDFFEIVGIPILNGYGLTETSPVLSVRKIGHNLRGSVGPIMRNTEITIRNDADQEVKQGETGHVWARGPQIMRGYYNNPEGTSKVINEDGWFITGDLGWMTPYDDLVISGRAKDTIVLSSGENVEPDNIEDVCRQDHLIQQIVVVGQDQKSLGALIVPEYGALAEALEISPDLAPEEIASHENAVKILKKTISDVMNADGRFKTSESIGKIYVLAEPFTESNGMLTNTMKIKKNVVFDKYKDEIASLYN